METELNFCFIILNTFLRYLKPSLYSHSLSNVAGRIEVFRLLRNESYISSFLNVFNFCLFLSVVQILLSSAKVFVGIDFSVDMFIKRKAKIFLHRLFLHERFNILNKYQKSIIWL